MTELEFGARLKRLRQNKHLTQQELADQLGVSNKSVSRWESGGYPDVCTLLPLAKALDTTVDELLGGHPTLSPAPPAPSTRQNLLSYIFILAGGLAFFVLDSFLPTSVCYLVYLVTMAYGIHLQQLNPYHRRWFYGTNGLMNFCINLHLTSFWARGAVLFSEVLNFSFPTSTYYDELSEKMALVYEYALYLLVRMLPWFLTALVLTLVTQLVIWRACGNKFTPLRLSFSYSQFSRAKALPALAPLVLTLFWVPYCSPAPLPLSCYEHQDILFFFLLCFSGAIVLLFLWFKRHRKMILAAAPMLLGCRTFPILAAHVQIFSKLTGNLLPEDAKYNAAVYLHFGQFSPWMLLTALLLSALYLICCFIKTDPLHS